MGRRLGPGVKACLGEGNHPVDQSHGQPHWPQRQPIELNPHPQRPWLITGRMSISELKPLNGASWKGPSALALWVPFHTQPDHRCLFGHPGED